MKKTPYMQRLEESLRSSKFVAGGFLGSDNRDLSEIIDRDMAVVSGKGYTVHELSERMAEITEQAKVGLGTWVQIDEKQQARVEEAKGLIICPWPHPARFDKRVTILQNTEDGREIVWSDLSIHLIAEHGFFEGKGTSFRIEPSYLIEMLFGG